VIGKGCIRFIKDSSGGDCIRGIKEIVGKWIVERSIYFLTITITITIRSSGTMIIICNVIVIIFNVGVRRGLIGFLGAGSSKRKIMMGSLYHIVIQHPVVS
jgi:hypothetical protein